MSSPTGNKTTTTTTATDDDNAIIDATATATSTLQEPLLPPPQGYDNVTVTTSNVDGDNNIVVEEYLGHVQPPKYRDVFWAILFIIQLISVITLAILGTINLIKEGSEWVPYQDDDDSNSDTDDNHGGANLINGAGILFFVTLAVLVALVSTCILQILLGVLSSMMIQVSLVVSPICFAITFLVSMITFNIPLAFFSLFMAALGVFYAWGVWHRIPFATANIDIALTALKAHSGLWIWAFFMTIKAFLWTLLWTCTLLEVFVFESHWIYKCEKGNPNSDDIVCHWSIRGRFIAITLLLSLFWTAQVLKNLYHTTIAGVVGTWWFDPADDAAPLQAALLVNDDAEEQPSGVDSNEHGRRRQDTTRNWNYCCGCCTPTIYDAWTRSITYSFGSVCLGSLLVGILQVLRFLVYCGRTQQQQQRRQQNGLREPNGGDLCCCMLQFVVDNLEYVMEYANQWAFVYVGLYGYDYWTAGKQVSGLFQARGWSNIINDHLISRALGMMSVFIGLITGLLGTLIGFFFLGPLGALPTFFVGMVLGSMCCNILFGVITSAVNTVVVCFAEAPDQLRINHPQQPELYEQLVSAWRVAYPEDFGF